MCSLKLARRVFPDLLVSLNRVAAAKVDAFMGIYAAGRRVPA